MKFRLVSNSQRKIDLNMERVNQYVSRFRPGTPISVEIVRRQRKKSDPLRKMYFAGVLPEFAKGVGYDPDEYLLFHRQLKITYFQIAPDKRGIYRNVPHVFANKSEIPVPGKVEFVEWVLRKAAQNGVYIETPNDDGQRFKP